MTPDRADASAPLPVLLVTGLSGAGKSTALRALEDLGYDAVDNLPQNFLESLVEQGLARRQPLALGIDARTRDFDAERVLDMLARLRGTAGERQPDVRLVYMDCDDDVIARRFTETRRRHPLARDRMPLDGIRQERALLRPLLRAADEIIDTSLFTPHDVRRVLTQRFGLERISALTIVVMSFAYRAGVPRQADLVFDVRFLRNPHYDEILRPRTGDDPEVAAHIACDPRYKEFASRIEGLCDLLLPAYEAEGKSYLTIAFGCTGGRHRSVHFAERLAQRIRAGGRDVTLGHRELERGRAAGGRPT